MPHVLEHFFSDPYHFRLSKSAGKRPMFKGVLNFQMPNFFGAALLHFSKCHNLCVKVRSFSMASLSKFGTV